MMEILAHEFASSGHDVTVITDIVNNQVLEPETLYDIWRKPESLNVLQRLRYSDVTLTCGVLLKKATLPFLTRTPLFISHHTWLGFWNKNDNFITRLKKNYLKTGHNIAVSSSLAESLETPCHVIPNPYRDDVYVRNNSIERSDDLIFVGRLVSDKGVDLLLKASSAVSQIRDKSHTVTIIGDGPERSALETLRDKIGGKHQVRFLGACSPPEIRSQLLRHKVMVVPSRWPEPFGVVALEGIACGCALIGTSGGGLSEAIGPSGTTVPNGDLELLTEVIVAGLDDLDWQRRCRIAGERHILKYSKRRIAEEYIQLFEKVIG